MSLKGPRAPRRGTGAPTLHESLNAPWARRGGHRCGQEWPREGAPGAEHVVERAPGESVGEGALALCVSSVVPRAQHVVESAPGAGCLEEHAVAWHVSKKAPRELKMGTWLLRRCGLSGIMRPGRDKDGREHRRCSCFCTSPGRVCWRGRKRPGRCGDGREHWRCGLSGIMRPDATKEAGARTWSVSRIGPGRWFDMRKRPGRCEGGRECGSCTSQISRPGRCVSKKAPRARRRGGAPWAGGGGIATASAILIFKFRIKVPFRNVCEFEELPLRNVGRGVSFKERRL